MGRGFREHGVQISDHIFQILQLVPGLLHQGRRLKTTFKVFFVVFIFFFFFFIATNLKRTNVARQ